MDKQNSITVLTLDAGGTNFVFSAIRDFEEVLSPIELPAQAHDYDLCMANLFEGFEQLASQLESFDAISFAFPGPANYELGIIGNLPNFPAFKGKDGVPLADIIAAKFEVPVYINNDGNLFALGEATRGILPTINQQLKEAGSQKQFKNLIGITLGTGFGCGIVLNGQMLIGDNSCGAEVHNLMNPFNEDWNAEESVSTRAITRMYAAQSGDAVKDLTPQVVFEIAKGKREGNQGVAISAFQDFGLSLGASICNILTLIDGVVVIGGGLSAGWDMFAPSMFEEIRRTYSDSKGLSAPRLSFQVFDLEDFSEKRTFLAGEKSFLKVPNVDRIIEFDGLPRTGIIRSQLGGSRATWLGAYAFALQNLQP